ncbi:uncharacterized protein B0H18DRAFT_1172329 [Fomitopsis serialis]|uniref:uncharacterized protein n=1 Tax=Fomitopsis serialis TaxID=139415 RepID=UPI0020081F92|nr:uncharacterized protein B0H18DRAFT_1172329 [Neoantrodia serialis]KAH9910940.1 hypothetical protein B0H18DRAFT_1172329 [Neoantrodia serialis]
MTVHDGAGLGGGNADGRASSQVGGWTGGTAIERTKQARAAAHLTLVHTMLDPSTRAVPTGETSTLPTSLVATSLGHRAEPSAPWYDPALGHLRTLGGRVLDTVGWTVDGEFAEDVLPRTVEGEDPPPETEKAWREGWIAIQLTLLEASRLVCGGLIKLISGLSSRTSGHSPGLCASSDALGAPLKLLQAAAHAA